jgi:multidrug efflux pump subunit AcrB
VDLTALKEAGERIERELRRSDLISQVAISGFPDREIEIGLTEANVRKYDLTFQQVRNAVAQANIELTGGTIETPTEDILIRARSKTLEIEQIKAIVLRSDSNGRNLTIGDVAEVSDRWEDSPGRRYLDGRPSVVINVQTTVDEDIIAAADYVNAYIKQFNAEQDELKIDVIRDGSVTLQERIDLLLDNGLIGVLLVFGLLALVLHHKLAFWTALGIPISFLGMFIFMLFFGYTINVISLFGMIIVVGILVDDGVVVSENIYRLHEEGYDRYTAAIKGTLEVIPSITSGILTTVTIFSIFFFIEGTVGNVLSDIAFVVIVTLLMSLIEAFFILPSHIAHSKSMEKGAKPNWLQRFMDKVMFFLIQKTYRPVLEFVIRHSYLPVAIVFAILISSFGLIRGGFVKTTFFPIVEQDFINISLELPSGTNEDKTMQTLDKIQAAVDVVNAKYEEQYGDKAVLNVDRTLGPRSNQGVLSLILLTSEKRVLRAFELNAQFREELGYLPEADKLSFTTQTPFGDAISIAVIGDDLTQIRAAKELLKERMRSNPNLKDVNDNDSPGNKEITLSLKEQAYTLGFTLQQLMSQVRSGFFGAEVQRLQKGEDEIRVWVRYLDNERTNIAALQQMRINAPNGNSYPLSELATINEERGVININHIDGFREVRVSADVGNISVSVPDELGALEANVFPEIQQRYPGVKFQLEGQSRETAKTQRSAAKVLPVLLGIMFALIIFTFRSFSQTLLIFIIIPFALTGVIFGHWVHGIQFGVLSVLGVIALIGVLVNDSLVFINGLNARLKTGELFKDAVLQTGLTRFRPIVLTTVTTVAGLSPIINETSFQAQFLIPMAISIAYGLAYATTLTLILLPGLLLINNKVKIFIGWVQTGEWPRAEEVESAVKEIKAEKIIGSHSVEI